MNIKKKDKEIIDLLNENGRLSLSAIAKHVGLSHVAVGNRINNLIKNKIIKIRSLINLKNTNFILKVMCLEVKDRHRFIEIYIKCPRVIFMMKTTGEYNLIIGTYAEDSDTLNSLGEKCSMANHELVKKSSINISTDIIPEFIPFNFPKKGVRACNFHCSSCSSYLNNKCVGCPGLELYKDHLSLIH